MKYKLLATLLLIGSLSCSQSGSIDERLVGIWEGSNLGSACDSLWWTIHRKSNGTYSTDFYREDSKVNVIASEKGEWWIEGGFYFLINDASMIQPDKYEYQLLDSTRVQMMIISYDKSAKCTDGHRFIDTKI